ncbi:sensor domain-containing diguanylate cyclase [Aquibacillus kalidii]|uniref:sensor domain-containing diguanylate cyclase n=1 Tax=Aquibacillus kalidii TaxID=2762597 RepID=UPI001F44DCB5|nr:sensor domain-containing diguanylate cyclase [Aquibacillus kalidii]
MRERVIIKLIIVVSALIIFGGIGLVLKKSEVSLKLIREKSLNEKRLYNLVESSRDIIYYFETNPDFRFRYLSPSIEHFFGDGHLKDCMENPLIAFENIHPEDFDKLKDKISGDIDYTKPILQRWKNETGEYLWFEEYATPIIENDIMVGVQGIIRCVEEKIKLQNKLKHQIYHDSLTGLHNRQYFDEKLERLNQESIPVGVIMCDLDNLKQVNDTMGHRAGDKLIVETAKVLSSITAENIDVTRIGGDEFFIFMTHSEKHNLYQIIDYIDKQIQLYNKSEQNYNLVLSLGCSYSLNSYGKMEQLYLVADQEMYKAKNEKLSLV